MGPALAGAHPPQKQKHGLTPWRETVSILFGRKISAAQTQLRDDAFVTLHVLGLHIVQQVTAQRHHLDHAAARMIVLGVGLEMFGEIGDALRQDRDLHFRRTGIILAGRVLGDQLFLAFRGNHSVIGPFKAQVEKLKTRNGRSSPSAISANATGDPSASFKNTVWP